MEYKDMIPEYVQEYRAKYDDQGREVMDNTPVEVDAQVAAPLPLVERIRALVRGELSRQAVAEGFESAEEADDFDVPEDGDDFASPYEEDFEPVPEGAPPAAPAAAPPAPPPEAPAESSGAQSPST